MNKSLEVVQGSTFEWLILMRDVNKAPLDMTGYLVNGDIKADFDDDDPVTSFDISILNKTGVLAAIGAGTCHLTTAEIATLVADTAGKCYLLTRLEADTTSAVMSGSYVYDIEVEDTTGYIEKPYRGTFEMLPESTTHGSSI